MRKLSKCQCHALEARSHVATGCAISRMKHITWLLYLHITLTLACKTYRALEIVSAQSLFLSPQVIMFCCQVAAVPQRCRRWPPDVAKGQVHRLDLDCIQQAKGERPSKLDGGLGYLFWFYPVRQVPLHRTIYYISWGLQPPSCGPLCYYKGMCPLGRNVLCNFR